jgi:hypothetical protein
MGKKMLCIDASGVNFDFAPERVFMNNFDGKARTSEHSRASRTIKFYGASGQVLDKPFQAIKRVFTARLTRDDARKIIVRAILRV